MPFSLPASLFFFTLAMSMPLNFTLQKEKGLSQKGIPNRG